MDDNFNGPYLSAAVICERVLQEKDGVNTLVRLIDRTIFQTIGPGANDVPAPKQVALTFYIGLKAGTFRGKGVVSLTPVLPNGRTLDALEMPAIFDGEERGANFALAAVLGLEDEGLYWFEVRFEGQLLTKIPYRIVYESTDTKRMPDWNQR